MAGQTKPAKERFSVPRTAGKPDGVATIAKGEPLTKAADALRDGRVELADPVAVEMPLALAAEGPLPPAEQVSERIRKRAYELYLQRNGGNGGDALSDWLTAEREVLSSGGARPS